MRTKKETLDINAEFKKEKLPFESIIGGWDNIGSNCWAVHGNFTQSGKPIISCDPHLAKNIHSTWYPTRIAWNEKFIETN